MSDLLVLSRADIATLMDYGDYVDAVEAAFRAAAEGLAVAPPASALHVPTGSFHAKGAALLGDEAKVAMKINGNFPGNPAANGLPTVQGVIYLADGGNGRPLALMDSILTAPPDGCSAPAMPACSSRWRRGRARCWTRSH